MPPFCTLTVDTEEEWDWSSGCPTGGYTTRNIQALPRFQALCERFQLAVTYFANYAVLRDPQARDVVVELAHRHGVEIGLHIHPWNTPPIVSPDPVPTRETFLHNLPESVACDKLNAVYQTFTESGLAPVSFRGGRYSTSPAIQGWLIGKGFIADASVVPYTRWHDEGAPDYGSRTPEPIRHAGNSRQKSALWEIPLTRGFTRRPFAFWNRCYDRVERSPLRKLRLIGVAERLGLIRKIWLNFEQHTAEELLDCLKRLRNWQWPYACLTLHSSSLTAGMSPYTRTSADETRLFEKLETVFRQIHAEGWQPATVGDVARHLEANYANSGHQPAR